MKNRAASTAYEETDAIPVKGTERPILDAGIGRFGERLREAIGGRGLRAFGKLCGLSEGAIHSYLSGDTFPTLDRLSAISAASGKSPGWFIEDPDGPKTASLNESQPLRLEGLTIAIQLAAEALEGKYLPPEKYAELVSLIYDGLEEGLPEATILRFARIAKPE